MGEHEKTFLVAVREVHVQQVRVKANDAEDAKARVAKGEGDQVEGSLEYSHTLGAHTWTVEGEESKVRCYFCRKEVPEKTAHLIQVEGNEPAYVGDDCCWDERLRN